MSARVGGPRRARAVGPGRAGPRAGVARATSIEGIEQELARIWAQPNLHPDADGDEVADRHVAARTSVMNLVVIARRPEVGERCAATIQRPDRAPSVADPDRVAGRSRRSVLARRPDPGPLRPAPRERAGDLRRDDLPDVRRRVRPPSRRDRRPAPHPRPAGHGLVARRAAVRDGARQRRLRDGRPARRRRLDVARRRASTSSASWRRSRSAGRSRSPTSRWSASRAGARRSPRSSTSPTSCRTSATSAGSA